MVFFTVLLFSTGFAVAVVVVLVVLVVLEADAVAPVAALLPDVDALLPVVAVLPVADRLLAVLIYACKTVNSNRTWLLFTVFRPIFLLFITRKFTHKNV